MPGGLKALVIAAAAVLALLAAPAAQARGLQFGLVDPLYSSADRVDRALWLDRTGEAGAELVRAQANWRAIAPRDRPDGFDPADPADPAYRWSSLDSVVRDATAHGLSVVLMAVTAPTWAEGPNRPALDQAPAGSWRPDPDAFGDFARALAMRYSGQFPDPLNPGRALPRVRYFQAWNEPNLRPFLNPQEEGGKLRSPDHYRQMLNSFYSGVNAAGKGNRVIAPAMAPYGDSRGGLGRTRPVRFLRDLLCLKGRRALRPTPCPKSERARFDILGHNAINSSAGPRRHAIHPDDASSYDLGRLERVLRRAKSTGRALPKGPKPLWVTEAWWRSNPPDPRGAPPQKHAKWVEEGLYLYWKQGARAVMWFRIRDPLEFDPAQDVGSGLYFRDGTKKPAYQAYRFPFVTDRIRGKQKSVQAWGRAPQPGRVSIQKQQGSAWGTIKGAKPESDGIFVTKLKVPRKTRLRAVLPSGETSLTWTQR
jgi:hypothetical protein